MSSKSAWGWVGEGHSPSAERDGLRGGASIVSSAKPRRPRTPLTLLSPARPRGGGRFNSVLGQSRANGGVVDHREYVVFDKAQAVPIAVVTYRHRPSCKCSRCCS